MNNSGTLIAVDSSSERLQRLRENLLRMNVLNTQVIQCDMTNGAAIADCSALNGEFDRILIDAPCSAAGIMRKHPDVLVQLKASDPCERQTTQRALLQNALGKLKPGGHLAYATCSVFPEENEKVVQGALAGHEDRYTLCHQETLPISRYHDGFYLALIQKVL